MERQFSKIFLTALLVTSPFYVQGDNQENLFFLPEKGEEMEIQRSIYNTPIASNYRTSLISRSAPLHFHFYCPVGEKYDLVGLEDGSLWKLEPSDYTKLYQWRINDTLIVSPNTSWWYNTNYHYIITNVTANSYIYANLFIGPKAFGSDSHWVVALDREHSQVFLENGSSWYISPSDVDHFYEWEINDTVIIGVYDRWFGSYDRVLINVNMNHYVRAVQFSN